ncbi:MAG: SRPBCC family protein [Chitinophagales bacterium]
MKKFLRFLVVLLVVVAAAILILALVEPTDIVVSRSAMIKAPKEAVFEQMVLFKNWPNWSPWYKMDTGTKMTYSGTDGQPGSSYHWVGTEKKTGEGDMKNVAVNGTAMDFEVNFNKPRKATAHGTLKAMDTAGMTKATWSFSIHIPFPLNAMPVFMNMDKMLGDDFENGLANMKQYVESHPAASSSDVEIKEVNYPAQIFEGFRKTVNWADIGKFSQESFPALGKELDGKIAGPGTELYYTWDTVNKNTDIAACFPVSDTTKPAKGAIIIHVAASKAYMTIMKGSYSNENEMKYHTALSKHLAAKGQKQSLVIEEYPVGPFQETDSAKWVTNIYYLIQ